MSRTVGKAIAAVLIAALHPLDGVRAEPPPSCANPIAIGVSRVVEVDTMGGPRFGAQFDRNSLLGEGEVVLTFDDGPLRPFTHDVLAALAAHCTKATFFMVGRRAMADPELAKEVARQDHTVGTHTWSHRNMSTLTLPHALAEIDLGVSAVRKAVGAPIAPFFRFPYLVHDEAMLAHLTTRNLAAFSIDIDPFDYRTQDPSRVVRDVVRRVLSNKKGIILLHDVEPSTAQGLKIMLDELHARGIRIVHLVPSGSAQTVPVYDAFVAKPLNDAERDLLGKRSTYWPLTKAGDLAVGVPASAKGSRSKVSIPSSPDRPRPPTTRH
jgi:peptidoglycan/xylan/chitin deacetylase (PgdA/CDA1 family)